MRVFLDDSSAWPYVVHLIIGEPPNATASRSARHAHRDRARRRRLSGIWRTVTAAERAQYCGTYALNLGGAPRDFTFFERDGELYGQLAGQGANVFIPAGHDTYGASSDPTLRIIFTVENGKATNVTLKQAGQSFDGMRRP